MGILDVGADSPIPKRDRAVRHLRDGRVVGDQRGGGAELPIHLVDHLQHDPAGGGVRAPVGSSQSRISGRFTMALAMAMRCCCPPDS